MLAGRDRRQGIELIVYPSQCPLHVTKASPLIQDVKGIGFTVRREVAHRGAKAANLAPATQMQNARQTLLQAIDQNAAAGRHRAHQVVKLALYGRQVIEDIGVVKLKIVKDRRARTVVNKFASFVKEGGIVFVGFNHKVVARAQSCRDAKIQRYTADQESRLQTGAFQYPGDHRCRAGLAMGAGNGDDMAPLQHVLGQPLWATGVAQSGIQNSFHQGKLWGTVAQVHATHHIAHHKHVRLQCQLIGAKTFHQPDTQSSQLVAHGWVNACIATRHFVTGIARQRGQATHESTANTENMNVHGGILGRRDGRKMQLMDSLKSEISALAARLVVEEGLEYGPAKRRAARQLGLPSRSTLPGNDELEQAVTEYIALFCANTQALELRALRRLALVWMERMAGFWPHLGGAVWHGSATRLSDIYIQLFCDDSKSAELSLIDHKVNYLVHTVLGLHGESVEALSVHAFCPNLNEEVGVHLLIYDRDDVRGALQPDPRGRRPRGDLTAVRRLLQDQ